MRRLFTFGCSFTKYCWPTWADILGKEYEYFENWGCPGAGNQYIFNSLIECIKKNNISKNDTIIIMWSSLGREDRWIKSRGWVTPGSIYNQTEYSQEFVTKWADPKGYLIRDIAYISAVKIILESIGCNWEFISMVPIDYYDDSNIRSGKLIINDEIKTLYSSELSAIKPSIFTVIFKNNWASRAKYKPELPDDHPTPAEHLLYLNAVLPNYTISKSTEQLVKDVEVNVILDKPFDWAVWGHPITIERF